MSRLFTADAADSTPHEIHAEKPNGKPEQPRAAESSNGKPAESTASAQAKPEAAADEKAAPGSRVERAEELTDKIAVGVALFASTVGRKIVRAASHVGETLSDIWAEAQSVRKGKK